MFDGRFLRTGSGNWHDNALVKPVVIGVKTYGFPYLQSSQSFLGATSLPRVWKSEDELSEAINLLMARMSALQAKSVERDIQSDSVNIAVIESGFRSTVREIFGQDSCEFQDYGRLEMFRGPLRVGMTSNEVVSARLRGREYMVAICVELIGRLQQKSLALRQKVVAHNSHSVPHAGIDNATRDLLANGHHWEAVFAASKTLILLVKDRSGRRDLDGVALMRTVFSKQNPILRFNAMESPTDLDEQEGMMHLFEGAVMALRNPGGHAFPAGPESRALQYIQFVSLLAQRVDEAQA